MFRYRTDEIIQIGAVKMSDDYEILDTFSTYVKPRYKLEKQKDYKMLIERIRASEKDQEPLTASLGDLFQGLKLRS